MCIQIKSLNYFSVIYKSDNTTSGNTYCKQALKAVDTVHCMICDGPCFLIIHVKICWMYIKIVATHVILKILDCDILLSRHRLFY